MGVNNYIRIGIHPSLTILTFDDRNPAEVERVKLKTLELTGGRPYNSVGQWKRCVGLSYPLIGEPEPRAMPRSMV